jgi:glycerol kinase
MSRYLLALDQGTTSSRSIVFDARGAVVASAQREFAQHYPQPGWVEHDPLEIWATQRQTMVEALAQAQLAPDDIAAIGITNQRETTLLWERSSGRPLGPAIVWQDRRTVPMCEQLTKAGQAEHIQQRTGLVLDAYFSATKLAWMLDHWPAARARAERGELAFGTVDSWLVWNLTGGAVHATDVSNASRTLLLDLERGDWDDTLLELFRIPRALLPAIVPSSGVLGEALLGTRQVPIAGIAGDQQAALFGQACFTPGMAKNTYGTGCFLLMHTGSRPQPSSQRLLATAAWDLAAAGGRSYALEGSVFIGGAVVQWLRDGLGFIESSAAVEALAASVPDSGGVMLVPAFAGLGAPHWDGRARGTLLGLTRGSTRAHIARAALEAIAYQSAELLAAMQADLAARGGPALAELRVDGGATANDLLMQFQADLLGVPVLRPVVRETTALGAAYLAGLAAGVWSSQDDIARAWRIERLFEPRIGADERQARMARWRRAVERAKGWEQD